MTRRLLAPLLLAFTACRGDPPPPTPAGAGSLARVERRDVPVVLEATGTVEPMQTARVAPQVSGLVTRVAFREGQDVTEGQVLFAIDPRPFQAALAQAEGALARDAADFAAAQRDVERFGALAEKEYVTAQQLDQARTRAAGLAATLRSDSGAVERARLDLQYATVRAPIAGRTGGLLVREGNLVQANGSTPLVVINQLAPILVRFTLPADQLAAVRARGGQALPVVAVPVGDTARSEGELVFLDNAVDSLSGTIALKARFENRDGHLWPGALVRVRLELDVERQVLVVPAAAVVAGQQGDVVFVAGDDGQAHVRPVRVRRTSDTLAVLDEGVESGTQVITDGQVRLSEGTRIAPRPAEEQAAQ
jgi:multidrug efflux system membrane fusion protein